jgi:hypothetical protein
LNRKYGHLFLFFLISCLFFLNVQCSKLNAQCSKLNARPSGFIAHPVIRADKLVNLAYLDHLTTEMTVGEEKVLAVAIYANAPDYVPVDEPSEGYACVDDVARAAVLLMEHWEKYGEESSLRKAKGMVTFVLKLQCGDGLFYNFVYPDGTINLKGKTSLRSFDFWTSRGMWVLGRAVEVFETRDPAFARRCERAARLTLQAFAVRVLDNLEVTKIHGRMVPDFQLLCGNDCWSEALLGIVALHRAKPSSTSGRLINLIANGLAASGAGNMYVPPFGALGVSAGAPWAWHGWGNRQALALIEAGVALDEQAWIEAAKGEIEVFHDHLLRYGIFASCDTEPLTYPQIAYTLSPLIQSAYAIVKYSQSAQSCVEAGLSLSDNKLNISLTEQRKRIALFGSWFFGNNPAGTALYSKDTGRCLDGIDGGRININGGAESTIEALFAMMVLDEIPEYNALLHKKTEVKAQRVVCPLPEEGKTLRSFTVKEVGSYVLTVYIAEPLHMDLQIVLDEKDTALIAKGSSYGPLSIGEVYLEKGNHKIAVVPYGNDGLSNCMDGSAFSNDGLSSCEGASSCKGPQASSQRAITWMTLVEKD